MPSRWQKWRALSRRERRIAVEAGFEILRTARRLRRGGLARAGQDALIGTRPEASMLHSGSAADAVSIARIVEIASTVSPVRPNCLQRSVSLWRILHRHGIGSEVRIGARADPRGDIPAFHAWTEHNGVVLNDHPDVASAFVPFSPRPHGTS